MIVYDTWWEKPDLAPDLNALTIRTDDPPAWERALDDHSTTAASGTVRVVFRELAQALIARIQQADIVVGCIAWLTHEEILAALARTKGVALVVQKEDFLRPDLASNAGWAARLRQLYGALPATLNRLDDGLYHTTLYGMSSCGETAIDAVRCVGNYNEEKSPAFPRMHHKFLVFCRLARRRKPHNLLFPTYDDCIYIPYEVWTGSFNFTHNATWSFENALMLTNRVIVQAYFKEWAQVMALSEPLDWEVPWVCPEWRIGT